jgi:hypothetical protein
VALNWVPGQLKNIDDDQRDVVLLADRCEAATCRVRKQLPQDICLCSAQAIHLKLCFFSLGLVWEEVGH